MNKRRVEAISVTKIECPTNYFEQFCDVDNAEARKYLEKHNYNPEPVIKEIDRNKQRKCEYFS